MDDSAWGTVTNTYDALDRVTSQAQPHGTVSYTYVAGSLGLVARLTEPLDGSKRHVNIADADEAHRAFVAAGSCPCNDVG